MFNENTFKIDFFSMPFLKTFRFRENKKIFLKLHMLKVRQPITKSSEGAEISAPKLQLYNAVPDVFMKLLSSLNQRKRNPKTDRQKSFEERFLNSLY